MSTSFQAAWPRVSSTTWVSVKRRPGPDYRRSPQATHPYAIPLKRPRGWVTGPIDPRFSLKLRKITRIKTDLRLRTTNTCSEGGSSSDIVVVVHCPRLTAPRAFHISTSARRKAVGFIRHSTRPRPNWVAFLCLHVLSSRATSWHHIQF